jgi:hypothetical protein
MNLLSLRSWTMPAIAVLGAALLFSGVLRSLVALMPYLAALAVATILVWTFLGTRGQAGSVRTGEASASVAASVASISRTKLGLKLDPQHFTDDLGNGPPLGMPPWLARHVSVTLRAFLVRTAPERPWSLMLASDESWCLDEFTRRFCKAMGLSASQVPHRLECTTIMEFGREPIAKAIADSGVPLLIINATERLRQHGKADTVTSPLEVILQGRDPLLKDIVILILEKSRPPAVHPAADLSALLREHSAAMKAITAVPVDEVGITCVLARLDAREDRLTILWEDFCRYAEAEYAVKIDNASTLEASPEDGMWDFLGTALDEWDQHGMSGARDFVRLASEAAFARARVAGLRSARAVWEPASQRVNLKT